MFGVVGVIANVSNQISAGELILAAIGVIVAVPAAIIAVNSLRDARNRKDDAHIANVVKNFLVGDDAVLPTSPDNPNMRDLLVDIRNFMEETRDNTSDLSLVSLILAHHLSIEHGGKIPSDLALWSIRARRHTEDT